MAVNDPLTLAHDRLPEGYTARPGTLDDIQAAVDLCNTCALVTDGAPDITVEDLTKEWRSPGFNPATDTVLIFAPDGQLAALSEFWNVTETKVRPYLFGRVHPDHTGRGLGSALFAAGEQRAAADVPLAPAGARVTLRCASNVKDQAAVDLFADQGYAVERYFWHMLIEMDAPPPEPQWPAGITVRALPPNPTRDELRRVFDTDQDAFRDHWGFLPIAFERWLHWFEDNPDFDPTLWFTALDGDEIAGICLCRPTTTEDPERGWVNDLAVRRPWRRQGIALAMLHHCFGEFWRRGTRKVGLGVDASSLTGATRVYEKAGMHVFREIVSCGKVLRDGEELSTQSAE